MFVEVELSLTESCRALSTGHGHLTSSKRKLCDKDGYWIPMQCHGRSEARRAHALRSKK